MYTIEVLRNGTVIDTSTVNTYDTAEATTTAQNLVNGNNNGANGYAISNDAGQRVRSINECR